MGMLLGHLVRQFLATVSKEMISIALFQADERQRIFEQGAGAPFPSLLGTQIRPPFDM